jgi:hypothetical protein
MPFLCYFVTGMGVQSRDRNQQPRAGKRDIVKPILFILIVLGTTNHHRATGSGWNSKVFGTYLNSLRFLGNGNVFYSSGSVGRSQ